MDCPLPPSQPAPRLWQRLLWPVLALTALAAVGHLVRSQLSLRDTLALDAKLDYYQAHRADYDLVFVGNSLVYRGVSPPLFDARMAERGYTVRSFNLASGGMREAEVDLLVRHLLRTGDPPRHMLLGRVSNSARIWSWERGTWRVVAWHTPQNTVAAMHSAWLLPAPRDERLRLAATHARLFGQWLTTFGGGPRILRHLRSAQLAGAQSGRWAASAGFQDLESLSGRHHFRRRHRRFLRRKQRFVKRVETNLRRRRPMALRTEGSLQRQVRLAERVRAAGSSPVFVISPSQAGFARLDPAVLGGIPLLNFDQPALYPDLFDPELRFDAMHLGRAGAEIYSRLLADAFADLLDEGAV